MGQKVRIKNRSAGSVVYHVPDLKVRRDFLPGEIKVVDMDELVQLSYTQGGSIALHEYLQILDKPARQAVSGDVEPEYNFGDEEVKELILHGSLDSFLDALDFAPAGVLDLIKKYAVSLPMVDLNKMSALKDKLGFDVMVAINNSSDDEQQGEAPKKERRVAVDEDAPKKSGGRRTKAKATPEE